MTLVPEHIYSSFSCSFHHHFFLGFESFGNEEKLVSLLVYSSFRLVTTNGIRNNSVATSSTSFNSVILAQIWMNTESLRIHHSTSIVRKLCDLTRLVATEHVRKKYSLQESI